MRAKFLVLLVLGSASCGPADDDIDGGYDELTSIGPLTFVTIGFDDGKATQSRILGDLSSSTRGLTRATFYINSGRVGQTNFLTWPQVAQIAAAGHEIASHTILHENLVGLTYDQDVGYICGDRNNLVAKGFNPVSFAFPYGANDATSERAVASCLDSGRDVGGITTSCTTCAETLPPADLYAIRTPASLTNCPSAAAMEAYVQRAIDHGGGWLNLVFHNIALDDSECGSYMIKRADIVAFLDWLHQQETSGSVRVRTQRDVVGLRNPSFERAADPSVSDCWQRSSYLDNQGSFARVSTGHSGGHAEQISITSFTSGNRKLLADRRNASCLPTMRIGHRYRMSGWYQMQPGGGATVVAGFVIYYQTADGAWHYFAESRGFGATSGWTRSTWDTPAIPSTATAISAGVYLESVGVLTVDDLMLSDAGP